MFEILTRECIFATQKGAAYTTRNTMVIGGTSRDTNDFLGFGIVLSFADCLHVTTNLVSWCQFNLWVSVITVITVLSSAKRIEKWSNFDCSFTAYLFSSEQ